MANVFFVEDPPNKRSISRLYKRELTVATVKRHSFSGPEALRTLVVV
jgi:hypothetical protein